MINNMEPLHITESDLVRDIHALLDKLQQGSEIIIERDSQPLAIVRPAAASKRKISECIALLPQDSTALIDADFAADVEAAIAAHPEPLEPYHWD
jgi:hypothetical protein